MTKGKLSLTYSLRFAESLIEEDKEQNRSAWGRGVTAYAVELIEDLIEAVEGEWITSDDLSNATLIKKAMLNGASDWKQYSEGGCSLISDLDIAKRLCTPSELKRTKGGLNNPNSRESWIDVQSRALFQACVIATIAIEASL